MAGFWRWFDRGSRLDFAGTLLGYLFDWRTLLASITGGGVTFLWSAIQGRDPLDVWVLSLAVTASCIVIVSAIVVIVKRVTGGDLQIVYDEKDPRFVRPHDDYVRYYVGLRILCHRSVDAPNVRAQEGPFANEVLAIAHLGKPYGNVEIYKGGRLDWDDLEIFELIGISKNYSSEGALSKPQRFVLEARGHNVQVARAEFEYDPARMPMIRKLP